MEGLRKHTLVAAVQDRADGFDVKKGVAATPDRLRDALLMHNGLPLRIPNVEIGDEVPEVLLKELVKILRHAAELVTHQFRYLGNEDRATGALFRDLHVRREAGDWSLIISSYNYSVQVKEPIIGADAGVVVDIVNKSGARMSKASWFQAKRVERVPDELGQIKDLQEQMDKMHARTREGYAILYTPDGVRTFHGPSFVDVDFEEVFPEMVLCKRGDPNPDVLIDTLDSRFLLEILLGEKS